MRIQVVFLLWALVPMSSAHAGCFDFNTKIVKPLKEPIADGSSDKGKTEEGITWARVRGPVKKPIGRVLELLLDHNTTKSPKVDEMEVLKQPSPHYIGLHTVKFLIKPFLFVKVRWTEQWAYAIESGTVGSPENVVISYEKVDGTSYIPHLCGSIVLRKLGNDSTDVYQYEEAKAQSRSVDDTLHGLEGTLKTLRN